MEHAAATTATTTSAGNTTVADDGVCGFTPASVGLMLASALLFTVVYNASSFVFFRLSATYRHLPAKLQLRWDNRVASTLHALIIVPGCLHAFFFAYDTQNLTPHMAILGCNSGSPPPLFPLPSQQIRSRHRRHRRLDEDVNLINQLMMIQRRWCGRASVRATSRGTR
jgi:hypothetical protein